MKTLYGNKVFTFFGCVGVCYSDFPHREASKGTLSNLTSKPIKVQES